MSSPDSVNTLQQCDIIFGDDDYGPESDASDSASVTDSDEWMTVLETSEEMMELLRTREAYTGYANQQKGDLQSRYRQTYLIEKH